jgi:hypothetical protein
LLKLLITIIYYQQGEYARHYTTLRTFNFVIFRYTVQGELDPKACIVSETEEVSKKTIKKNLAAMFKEKFLNPASAKSGKISKDILFLRKKLRF